MVPDLKQPPRDVIEAHVRTALAEDFGAVGDLTATYFLGEGVTASARVVSRQHGVLAGTAIAAEVFRQLGLPDEGFEILIEDGNTLEPGSVVALVRGEARVLVGGERTALNYLQRLSGVATLTRRYVDAVADTPARILDTRKTTPGWRLLEKHAVRCGGGVNHRIGLYDAVMLKDNHLACHPLDADLREAIARLRRDHPAAWIEIEADTLDQVARFLELGGIDRILLDNMSIEELKAAVAMAGGRVPLEASGGVTLNTVAMIAATGVDFISVGAITHSAPALDLGLDFD